jgi:hypothetical protein
MQQHTIANRLNRIIAMTSDFLYKMSQEASDYPSALQQYANSKTPPTLSEIGNRSILQTNTIALFYSIQCPGDLILKTEYP